MKNVLTNVPGSSELTCLARASGIYRPDIFSAQSWRFTVATCSLWTWKCFSKGWQREWNLLKWSLEPLSYYHPHLEWLAKDGRSSDSSSAENVRRAQSDRSIQQNVSTWCVCTCRTFRLNTGGGGNGNRGDGSWKMSQHPRGRTKWHSVS